MAPHPTLWITHRGERHQQAALSSAPPELAITMRRSPSKEEILSLLPGMEFLVSERTGEIDADIIAAGKDLRLIQRLGSQTYDIDLAGRQGRRHPGLLHASARLHHGGRAHAHADPGPRQACARVDGRGPGSERLRSSAAALRRGLLRVQLVGSPGRDGVVGQHDRHPGHGRDRAGTRAAAAPLRLHGPLQQALAAARVRRGRAGRAVRERGRNARSAAT